MIDDFQPQQPAKRQHLGNTSAEKGVGESTHHYDPLTGPEPTETSHQRPTLSKGTHHADNKIMPLTTGADSKSTKLSLNLSDLDIEDAKDDTPAETALTAAPTQKSFWAKLNPKNLRNLTKKQAIILGVVVVLVVGAISGTTFALLHHSKKAPVVAAVKQAVPTTPQAKLITSPLTGLPVTADQAKMPVTGIMIENSQDARPQSGLDQAGVVFEAVAEGGITRFLALFQEAKPNYVGPIRSARPYYVDWLQGFDASLAHVGGSPEALGNIKAQGVKDLDQFYNGDSYTRITSRPAPHNVYTSLDRLQQLEASKGYASSTFTPWPRKADSTPQTTTASSIDIAISSSLYNVHYDYDAGSHTYKRSEGGKPHMEVDASGQQTQIAPKVVIGLVTAQGLESDGLHSTYSTTGSSTAYIFQDGTVTTATWHKTSAKGELIFTDSANKQIPLDAGQVWISVVGSTSDVSYKP